MSVAGVEAAEEGAVEARRDAGGSADSTTVSGTAVLAAPGACAVGLSLDAVEGGRCDAGAGAGFELMVVDNGKAVVEADAVGILDTGTTSACVTIVVAAVVVVEARMDGCCDDAAAVDASTATGAAVSGADAGVLRSVGAAEMAGIALIGGL